MARSKCHDAYEAASSRQQKVKRLQAKPRSQEVKNAQGSHEHHLNPDKDIHGKARQDLNKKKDENGK
jgi:hypothetical protein